MPMLLIRGTFRAKGSKPDGDTISFTPDDVTDWRRVPGPRPVVPRTGGNAPIRLEGIDALELHYGLDDSPSGVQHQPLPQARAASDALLKAIGFTDFTRDEATETITSTTPEVVKGYILTHGADLFGRCVALIGHEFQPAFNGYEVELEEEQLKRTANYQLVEQGMAYPTYYSTFPERLRASLTAAAEAARAARKGVWEKDTTLSGTKICGLTSLTADDGAVILPKLFRRLKDYLDLNPTDPSLSCFRAYLAGASEDRFFIPGRPELLSGLHHVVEVTTGVTDHSVRMTHGPTEIVFEER
ncbi:thermonuclease family protein [Streptomyces sp. NBC_00249]|nr:thermonuclease family protein [Streptomyces sp. NBC_00249]